MTLIPLLVVGALAVLLVLLVRRTRRASTESQSSSYGDNSWTPMVWTDGDSDSASHNVDASDCSGGDAGCDCGGGGGD
jgi:hypothetical protein